MTCGGGASPTIRSALHTSRSGCRRTSSVPWPGTSNPRPPGRGHPMRRRPSAPWRQARSGWIICPLFRCQGAPSADQRQSLWQEGLQSKRSAPCVRTSSTPARRCWSSWHDTRRTPPPLPSTMRRPPTPSKRGRDEPRGRPPTASGIHPPPGAPSEAAAPERGERKAAAEGMPPAVAGQGNSDAASDRSIPAGLPTALLSAPLEAGFLDCLAPAPPLDRLCATAESRRTRRPMASGCSPGTCTTVSSRRTSPSKTPFGDANLGTLDTAA